MLLRLLLDTHILIRWLSNARKLSQAQLRELEAATRRGEPLAFSAATLLEISLLANSGKPILKLPLEEVFNGLRANPGFRLLPIDYDVAIEAGWLGALQDPSDRAIVATARVHRLRLVTSDQRIIDSKLVDVLA